MGALGAGSPLKGARLGTPGIPLESGREMLTQTDSPATDESAWVCCVQGGSPVGSPLGSHPPLGAPKLKSKLRPQVRPNMCWSFIRHILERSWEICGCRGPLASRAAAVDVWSSLALAVAPTHGVYVADTCGLPYCPAPVCGRSSKKKGGPPVGSPRWLAPEATWASGAKRGATAWPR